LGNFNGGSNEISGALLLCLPPKIINMQDNSSSNHRRSIRLKGYDYSQAGAYFITICCQDKICRLGEVENEEMKLNEWGKIIYNEWMRLPERYSCMLIDAFQIMPNHIHAIIVLDTTIPNDEIGRANPAPTIGKIIGYFKYQTAKMINLPTQFWQRNYYEKIIRDAQMYQTTFDYIMSNPLKWPDDRYFMK
jgi:REP element-mobilizing transposase RayT